jgi:hypothetical protein
VRLQPTGADIFRWFNVYDQVHRNTVGKALSEGALEILHSGYDALHSYEQRRSADSFIRPSRIGAVM